MPLTICVFFRKDGLLHLSNGMNLGHSVTWSVPQTAWLAARGAHHVNMRWSVRIKPWTFGELCHPGLSFQYCCYIIVFHGKITALILCITICLHMLLVYCYVLVPAQVCRYTHSRSSWDVGREHMPRHKHLFNGYNFLFLRWKIYFSDCIFSE